MNLYDIYLPENIKKLSFSAAGSSLESPKHIYQLITSHYYYIITIKNRRHPKEFFENDSLLI